MHEIRYRCLARMFPACLANITFSYTLTLSLHMSACERVLVTVVRHGVGLHGPTAKQVLHVPPEKTEARFNTMVARLRECAVQKGDG